MRAFMVWILAALCATCSWPVAANAIYSWTTVSAHPRVAGVTGSLEVTDAAWLSGGISNGGQGTLPSSGGLVRLSIAIDGFDYLLFQGVDCASPSSAWVSFCSGHGNVGYFDIAPYIAWQYDLGFGAAGPYINARSYNGAYDTRAFSSAIDLYIDYGAGGPELPCQVYACRASGFWSLTTSPVPEPGPLVLSLLGLAGLVTALKRASKGVFKSPEGLDGSG
jgi:hypothetical protein